MRLRLLNRALFVILLPSALSSCTTRESSDGNSPNGGPQLTESVKRGELVYKTYCLTCHLAKGQGAPPMNPPLVNTSFVTGDKNMLIDILLEGMSNVPVDGERYRNVMPPFNYLSDTEIADVLNYVRATFGKDGDRVDESEVNLRRQEQNNITK